MKKTLSLILSLFIIAALFSPFKASAASSDSKAGTVTTSSGYLNVRRSASTGSSAVSKLSKGSYITLISKSGSWWQVEYGSGKYGYCHSDYITAVEGNPATVNITSGSLNVRSGAGTSYSRVASLSKGKTVIVLSTSGGWSRILYNGTKTGYVSANYLAGHSSSPSAYSSVSLNVPSYKQTDSRWANVTVGASGKTLSKIGCTTTAIAMMESYRTGETIYPSTMVKKLSYTSSGSVYWPDNYTVVTDSSGYLSAVYAKLKEGKPVLFGGKTSSGGQHWVVITGYTGSSTLSASGFTINDPGSASRTNLQQFLNSYPVFYKFFYYA